MPLQNRVRPTGEVVAIDALGTMMGNRGIIHDPATRTLLKSRWKHPAWVCCRLEIGGRKRTVVGPGTYTELFFLDEATAFAAGHRPCRFCRRPAFDAFKAAWLEANPIECEGTVSIKVIDRRIHRERVTRRRRQVRFDAPLETLCSGVMILLDSGPHLVWDDRLFPWSERGYGVSSPTRSGTVTVLTPRSTVAAMRVGYRPEVHPSLR